MTDESSAGYPAPSAVPPTASPVAPPQAQQPSGGGFDWLIESHQQSAPMAALTDDVPSPISAQPRLDFPDPAAPPAPVLAPPPLATALAAPVAFAPPTAFIPLPRPTGQQSPSAATGPTGTGVFALERHQSRSRSGNGALDWVAFALSFLVPPVGLLVGIGAAVADSRGKGYVASIAKAAIAIGAGLSLVLGVVFVVVSKIERDQAAHDAIVASSRAYCTRLETNPATLASDTFGWPAPGDTIPDSITAMQAYASTWKSLVAVAPTGIRADTQKVEAAAVSIASSVQSTQTLDDAGNVAQMQDVVAATSIHAWVSNYCH